MADKNSNKQLEVKVMKALDVPRVEGGSRDATAFVRITIQTDRFGQEQKSTSVSTGKNSNPSWRESLIFSSLPSEKSNRMIKLEIFNQDLFEGDLLLCEAIIPFVSSSSSGDNNDDDDDAGGNENDDFRRVASRTNGNETFDIEIQMTMPPSSKKNNYDDDGNKTKLYLQIHAKNPVDCQLLLHEGKPTAKNIGDDDGSAVGATSSPAPSSPSATTSPEATTRKIKDLSEFPEDRRNALVKCFGIFDVDGNGTLSASESLAAFLTFFPTKSASKLRAKIQEADLNKDGNLDLNEFARIAIQFV